MALKKVPIERVPHGSVLAEDVVLRGQNQTLLAKGTELDRTHLDTLQRHGVAIVTVEVKAPDQGTPAPAKLEGANLRDLVVQQHRWFGDTREDPVMAEIFRCVVNRAARGAK